MPLCYTLLPVSQVRDNRRHFLLLRQKESDQRKGDPGLPPLRGTLRCSPGQAAAELALRAQTVLADIP
jgi:hypothetical protein